MSLIRTIAQKGYIYISALSVLTHTYIHTLVRAVEIERERERERERKGGGENWSSMDLQASLVW